MVDNTTVAVPTMDDMNNAVKDERENLKKELNQEVADLEKRVTEGLNKITKDEIVGEEREKFREEILNEILDAVDKKINEALAEVQKNH